MSGYAEQNDILNPYLTVLETLKFTASCRLPASMNRMAVIGKVLDLMQLEDWLDVVVGVEVDGEGIPKHVRKRLTIAVQLVMLPKILFLDVSCSANSKYPSSLFFFYFLFSSLLILSGCVYSSPKGTHYWSRDIISKRCDDSHSAIYNRIVSDYCSDYSPGE